MLQAALDEESAAGLKEDLQAAKEVRLSSRFMRPSCCPRVKFDVPDALQSSSIATICEPIDLSQLRKCLNYVFAVCLVRLVSYASASICLGRAVQKKDALQAEFDELNHMLTHQPPSAWAKREKKYHDDKKLWDSQQAELTGKVKRLKEEVTTLKDNNRAVILQEQLQVR